MTRERLALMEPLLKQYKRRFAVLDLGAGIYPELASRISTEFDCVVTVVEQDPIRENSFGPRVMVLQQPMTTDDIVRLGECEHFDVALALNLLHWYEDWPVMLEALWQLGDHLYLQVPGEADDENESVPGYGQLAEMRCAIHARGAELIGETVQFPRHAPRPLWLWSRNGPRRLTRTALGSHEGSADTLIHSGFEECWAEMRRLDKGNKTWTPGINLANFCALHGVLPSRDKVVRMLREFPLPAAPHGDITPWNFVLDGEKLTLVDGGQWAGDDAAGIAETIRIIQEMK